MSNNLVRMSYEFSKFTNVCMMLHIISVNTLSHRFKVCESCVPNQDDWSDALKIVTVKSKRLYQIERQEMHEEMIKNPNQAGGFLSKVICQHKNWQQNMAFVLNNNADQRPGVIVDDEYDFELFFDLPDGTILKTNWHWDIQGIVNSLDLHCIRTLPVIVDSSSIQDGSILRITFNR